MATHNGGTAVKSGYYWNAGNWEFTMIPDDGGLLPGAAEQKYRKVPLFLLLLAAPLIGGLFVMFLPLIGFAMAIGFAAKRIYGGVRNMGQDVAASMGHDMVPGEAHFAGKGGEKKTEPKKDDALDALQKEIDEKRKGDQ
ncbi:MAG: hypothetical protein ACYC8T_22855 [Myxococcaceae bacterium]